MLITICSFTINVNIASASSATVVTGSDGIEVNGQCQLSEAIQNINDQAGTNVDCPAGDGVDDTITLPSGTITLTSDLPELTRPISIIGSGKSTTTIDADGYMGFKADFSSTNTLLYDMTFKDFTITGADFAAFYLYEPKTITLDGVKITNSGIGAFLAATTINVSNSDATSNTGTIDLATLGLPLTGTFAGIGAYAFPRVNTDIPEINITNTNVNGNIAHSTGLATYVLTSSTNGDVSKVKVSISKTSVMNNSGNGTTGISVGEQGGPAATVGMELSVDSVTVANNHVVATSANPVPGGNLFAAEPYSAGMSVLGNLSSAQNFTNLTATNNSAVNTFDDQPTIAGFTSVLNVAGQNLSIINATITNNVVTQTQNGPIFDIGVASGNNIGFYSIKIDFSNFDFTRSASAQNSIIAGNSRNGNLGSCVVFDKAIYGLTGTADLTPLDLGGNITDDVNCTDYRLESNILATLGPLQDNGGPVQTIALLPGSPAIGAAVHVLGITMDARGIARPSSPDVGAFQTVLAQNNGSITNTTGASDSVNGINGVNGTLPETGTTSTWLIFQAMFLLILGLLIVLRLNKFDQKIMLKIRNK